MSEDPYRSYFPPEPTSSLQTWEDTVSKSWETIELDHVGNLVITESQKQRTQRRNRLQTQTRPGFEPGTGMDSNGSARIIEKAALRQLCVVMDLSEAVMMTDLKPSRLVAVIEALALFVQAYFDQNPISQMAIVATFKSKAQVVSQMGGNPQMHLTNLNEWFVDYGRVGGNASFQSALAISEAILKHVPSYKSREILMIVSALTTVDAADIQDTIRAIKSENIKCSVVSLSCETHICRVLAHATGGVMHVATSGASFQQHVLSFVAPAPLEKTVKTIRSWLEIGFPCKENDSFPSLCNCHGLLQYSSYTCPKCFARYCSVPIDCKICGITLVSNPQLSRVLHHIFPVSNFEEVEFIKESHCFACKMSIDPEKSLTLKCTGCFNLFCFDCEEFIHEVLYNCPGCKR